jgi:hypothetical protein
VEINNSKIKLHEISRNAFQLSTPMHCINQTPFNWNINDMPWKNENNNRDIMMFDGRNNTNNNYNINLQQIPSTSTAAVNADLFTNTRMPRIKRKTGTPDYL